MTKPRVKFDKEIYEGVWVIKNFSESISKLERTFVSSSLAGLAGILLTATSPLALAQGQGSYGGYLDDLVRLIWVVGLIVVAVVAFIIYKIFGAKVMAVALVLFLAWIGHIAIKVRDEEKQKQDAYKAVLANMQSDCLKQGAESIFSYATGQEKVFVRIHGDLSLPDFQKQLVLDRSRLAPGLFFVAGTPDVETGKEALVVDVTYDRADVAGSLPDYRWASTRINVEIRKISDGALLARRTDVQVREGFCLGPDPLGGVQGFLKKVLKRSDIYAAQKAG